MYLSGENMEYNEEISLKELVLLLFSEWKIIVISTIVMIMISLGVYTTVNHETYSVKSNAILTCTTSFRTDYGIFDSNIKDLEDILALIGNDYYDSLLTVNSYEFPVSNLKPYVSIQTISQDSITITYSGLDVNSLHNLQLNVSQTFSSYLSTQLQTEARNYFVSELSNDVFQDTQEIKRNEDLISLFLKQLDSTDMFLTYNSLSPAYVSIATKIQDLKNINLSLVYLKSIKEKQIEELKDQDNLDSLSTITINVEITNDDTVTMTQLFPARSLFPIGFGLGLLIGIFVVLLKNYWIKAN